MAIFTGDNWGEPPVGTVLQRVVTTNSTQTSYSTYRSGHTLISRSITPKFSNSIIEIKWCYMCHAQGSYDGLHFRLSRGADQLATSGITRATDAISTPGTQAFFFQESAGSTNSRTYTLTVHDCNNDGGTLFWNRPQNTAITNSGDYLQCAQSFVAITEYAQ
jgi:hypothetical protein